jgi:SsrA-binding protein
MAGEKPIAENRKARHDYHFLERFEAGLVLTGSEVKSLREGRVSLQQSYADVRDGEAWLVGAHIDTYDQAGIQNHEPERDRKLLLRRRELDSLYGKVREKGLTLVPVRMYFKNGRAKVEIALARGKDVGDKRQTIKEREMKREMERAIRER